MLSVSLNKIFLSLSHSSCPPNDTHVAVHIGEIGESRLWAAVVIISAANSQSLHDGRVFRRPVVVDDEAVRDAAESDDDVVQGPAGQPPPAAAPEDRQEQEARRRCRRGGREKGEREGHGVRVPLQGHRRQEVPGIHADLAQHPH